MVRLDRAAYDALVDHARSGRPREVCGLLVGAGDRVTAVRRARNAAVTPRSAYAIAPSELLDDLEAVADAGREVVGFYHSHPDGPPRPSDADRRAAAWPAHVYLIVSLGDRRPVVDAWRWTGEAFEPEPVRVG